MKPAVAGCKVFTDPGGEEMGAEGTIETEPVTATTAEPGDSIVFTPEPGTYSRNSGSQNAAGAFTFLNKTYAVEGSVTGKPDGATISFTHAEVTEKETLTVNKTLVAGFRLVHNEKRNQWHAAERDNSYDIAVVQRSEQSS